MCNIINSIQEDGNTYIKDSCILGNSEEKRIFYSEYPGNITISNCTIDDDIFTNERYEGNVTMNKTIERTFINALSHIVTNKCDSFFDLYWPPTVEPNVPAECPRYLMSCIMKHLIIYPFRIIEFIFLLTMLPSDPSNDNYFDSNCIFLTDFFE